VREGFEQKGVWFGCVLSSRMVLEGLRLEVLARFIYWIYFGQNPCNKHATFFDANRCEFVAGIIIT
jgi:hypothetical protein